MNRTKIPIICALLLCMAALFLLQSCVSLQKCQSRYGLTTKTDTVTQHTVDTVVIREEYHTDTMWRAPEEATLTDTVPVITVSPGAVWYTGTSTKQLKGGGKLVITAEIRDSILRVNCFVDSLYSVISTLETTIAIKDSTIRSITQQQTVKTSFVTEWWDQLPLLVKLSIPLLLIIVLYLIIRNNISFKRKK